MLDCVCFVQQRYTTKGLKCMVREFSRFRQCNYLANSLTFDLRASKGLWFADWHPQIFSMHQIIAGMLCSNTNDFKLFNLLPPIFPLSRHDISYNGPPSESTTLRLLFWYGVPFCENLKMQ